MVSSSPDFAHVTAIVLFVMVIPCLLEDHATTANSAYAQCVQCSSQSATNSFKIQWLTPTMRSVTEGDLFNISMATKPELQEVLHDPTRNRQLTVAPVRTVVLKPESMCVPEYTENWCPLRAACTRSDRVLNVSRKHINATSSRKIARTLRGMLT